MSPAKPRRSASSVESSCGQHHCSVHDLHLSSSQRSSSGFVRVLSVSSSWTVETFADPEFRISGTASVKIGLVRDRIFFARSDHLGGSRQLPAGLLYFQASRTWRSEPRYELSLACLLAQETLGEMVLLLVVCGASIA